MIGLLLLGGITLEVARADDKTVCSSDGDRRFTVRDRGDRSKAIINDRGEKVGYAVRRGDSWKYFVNKESFYIDDEK